MAMAESGNFDTEQFLRDTPNDLISLDKWQHTVNLLAKLFQAPAGFIVQYTSQGFQATACSQQETNPYAAGSVFEPDVNLFCRHIVDTGQELYVKNAFADQRWDSNPEVHLDGFCSYLGVPISWPNGKPFGTFCVMDKQVTDYNPVYFELIRQLRDILEADLALMDQYHHCQKLAITDPLTELNNRRGFSVMAEQRIKLAKRMNTTLALFYIDVDKFKAINDIHGHSVGDDVLIKIAQALKSCTRSSDVVGRMGGDEFVALMMVDRATSLPKIELKLTQAINTYNHTKLPDFSATIGMTLVDYNLDIEQLLDSADKAMLDKKKLSNQADNYSGNI